MIHTFQLGLAWVGSAQVGLGVETIVPPPDPLPSNVLLNTQEFRIIPINR